MTRIMITACYLISWSILFLTIETLLRTIGAVLPFLAFFFFSSSFNGSFRMSFLFAVFAGATLDFVLGYRLPWDGLSLFLISCLGGYLSEKPRIPLLLESFLGGVMPVLMFLPFLKPVLSSVESFAVLLFSCFSGCFLLPLMNHLVNVGMQRLDIGSAAKQRGMLK